MSLRNDLAARQPYLEQDFSDAEYDRRLALMRAGMARENLDALIVYCGVGSYANVRWLTNFQPIYGAAFAIVRADGAVAVATDGVLHAEPMHSMVWTCRVADLRCSAGPLVSAAPRIAGDRGRARPSRAIEARTRPVRTAARAGARVLI